MKRSLVAGLMAAVVAVPGFAASGFYLGAGVGADGLKVQSKENATYVSAPTTSSATVNAGGAGFLGGVLMGYGYEWDNNLYLGAEIQGQYTDAKASYKTSTTGVATHYDNLTLTQGGGLHAHVRPGYWFTKSAMAYFLLGYGADQFTEKEKFWDSSQTASTTSHQAHQIKSGYDVGLGVQTNIGAAWALRLDGVATIYSGNIKLTQTSGSSTITRKLEPKSLGLLLSIVYTFGADQDSNGLLTS